MNARFVDTHCHLTHSRLRQDSAGAIARAKQAGVVAVVCASADIDETRASAELAAAEPSVYFLAGQHPHDAKDVPADYLAQLEALAARPKNVAIGEIGLDYHYDFSPRDVQRRVFSEQLALARRLDKMIVIHTREAFEDTLAIIKESAVDGRKVVFHSFAESSEHVPAVLDLGSAVSFSGMVTFKNAQALQASAMLVPDDRLLVETDAPFLSPEPVRKMKTNEPANVIYVASFLARLRGVSIDHLASVTTANAVRLFGLQIP